MQNNKTLRFTSNLDDGDALIETWATQAADMIPEQIQRQFLLALKSGGNVRRTRDTYGLTLEQALGLIYRDTQPKETADAH